MDRNFRITLLNKIASDAGILSSYVEKHIKDTKKPKFIALTSLGPRIGVFMSETAVKPDGTVDFIVNFRGVSGDPKKVGQNFNNPNAVIITAEASGPQEENMGSKLLEQQFGYPAKVNEMVSQVLHHLQKQFPDKKIKRGKLIISGFSGGGSVVARLIAEKDKINGGINGAIINDGLHSPIGSKTLDKVVEFAREAEKDPNLKFKLIHTAIKPSYTSTTETSNYILDKLQLKRNPIEDKSKYEQYGFVPASEAKSGGFEVVQMYDNPKLPYYVDNRPGSLGDTHVQSLWKGNPYIFRDVL